MSVNVIHSQQECFQFIGPAVLNQTKFNLTRPSKQAEVDAEEHGSSRQRRQGTQTPLKSFCIYKSLCSYCSVPH